MASTDLQKLVVQISANTEMLHRELRRAERITDGTVRAMGRSLKRSDRQWQKFGSMIKGAVTLAFAELGRRGVGELIRISDQYTELTSRVKQITRETGGFQTVLEGVYAAAGQTGTSISDNLALVQRLAPAAKEMGRTVEDVLRLNKAVQQLGVIGGTSQTAISAGTLQLGQGLSAGIFRAEEFNSVLENTPEVAMAIAKGLDLSVGALRNMVLQGNITSEQVFAALLGQTDEIAKRMSEVEITIGRAWRKLGINIDRSLGDSLQGSGVAGGIDAITESLFNNALSVDQLIEKYSEYNKQLDDIEARGYSRRSDSSVAVGLRRELDQIRGLLEQRGALFVGPMPAPTAPAPQDTSSLGFSVTPQAKPGESAIAAFDRGLQDNKDRGEDAIRQLEIAFLQSNDNMAEATKLMAEQRIRSFERMAEDGIISEEQLAQARILINQTTAAKIANTQEDQYKRIQDAIESFSRDAAQQLSDLALSGELSAKRIGEAFARLALNNIFNALITKPMESFFTSVLTGGLAGGGTINGPTLVGERGPEIFVPNTSGSIMNNSNSRGMGGQNVTIHQSLHFDTAVAPDMFVAIKQSLPMIVRASKQATLQAMRG